MKEDNAKWIETNLENAIKALEQAKAEWVNSKFHRAIDRIVMDIEELKENRASMSDYR